MAKMTTVGRSAASDWTAGLVAIFAAAAIGAGIPIALWFGLYQPKKSVREGAEKRLEQLNETMNELNRRRAVIEELTREAQTMEDRLIDMERPFADGDPQRLDVQLVRTTLNRLAEAHNIRLHPERHYAGAEIVSPGGTRVRFERGLHATQLLIDGIATFHDFGRFVAAMETATDMVVIPDSLICTNDSTGGFAHRFVMRVYVVEKRDIETVGQIAVASGK